MVTPTSEVWELATIGLFAYVAMVMVAGIAWAIFARAFRQDNKQHKAGMSQLLKVRR